MQTHMYQNYLQGRYKVFTAIVVISTVCLFVFLGDFVERLLQDETNA